MKSTECPQCKIYQPDGLLCAYCTHPEENVSMEEWARGRATCDRHGRELVHCNCPTPQWLRERVAREMEAFG